MTKEVCRPQFNTSVSALSRKPAAVGASRSSRPKFGLHVLSSGGAKEIYPELLALEPLRFTASKRRAVGQLVTFPRFRACKRRSKPRGFFLSTMTEAGLRGSASENKKENSWFHYNKYLASVKIACSPTMKRGGLRPISPSCGAGEAVDFLLFDGVNDRLGGNNYLWHSSILVAVNYKSQLAVEPDVFDESHLV
jgi:hypothetical protein